MKVVLAVIAIVLVVAAGAAYLYLMALGCGMNTTGCRDPFLSSLTMEGLIAGFLMVSTGFSYLAVAWLRR